MAWLVVGCFALLLGALGGNLILPEVLHTVPSFLHFMYFLLMLYYTGRTLSMRELFSTILNMIHSILIFCIWNISQQHCHSMVLVYLLNRLSRNIHYYVSIGVIYILKMLTLILPERFIFN